MAKKKAKKKKRAPNKPTEYLKSNHNPNHKEDFDKALELIVPRIEPKAKK